jgi:hypothetical protein
VGIAFFVLCLCHFTAEESICIFSETFLKAALSSRETVMLLLTAMPRKKF